jgi:hypothetical protein
MPSATHAAEAFACPLEPLHVPADEDPVGFDTSGLHVLPRSDVAGGLVAFARATDPPGLLCLSTRGRSGRTCCSWGVSHTSIAPVSDVAQWSCSNSSTCRTPPTSG